MNKEQFLKENPHWDRPTLKDLFIVGDYVLMSWTNTKVRMILNHTIPRFKSRDYMSAKEGGKNLKSKALDLLWTELLIDLEINK